MKKLLTLAIFGAIISAATPIQTAHAHDYRSEKNIKPYQHHKMDTRKMPERDLRKIRKHAPKPYEHKTAPHKRQNDSVLNIILKL